MRTSPHRFERDRRYPGPGVYFEEAAPGEAERIVTGRPAFLGVTAPVSSTGNPEASGAFRPRWLTRWDQFAEQFGEAGTGAFLGDAVRAFFANGGTACVILAFPLDERARRGEDDAAWRASVLGCLERLERVADIDLVCAPDLPSAEHARLDLQRAILGHCKSMGDRFAILDPRPGSTVEQVVAQWHELVSPDGALYFPWLLTAAATNPIPPCGHVAGVYARTDARHGVHKAPANEVVAGVVDVGVPVTDDQQRLLSDVGVNSVRAFPGRGIRVWGARTLSGRAEWRYVNVRRLFLSMRRWIEDRSRDLVFEPHDLLLWNRVRDRLSSYCYGMFQSGTLRGGTAEEAFYVKCDAETNPPAARERGEVIAEVGLAAARPAEFIVVRVTQSAAGASLVLVPRTTEGS